MSKSEIETHVRTNVFMRVFDNVFAKMIQLDENNISDAVLDRIVDKLLRNSPKSAAELLGGEADSVMRYTQKFE